MLSLEVFAPFPKLYLGTFTKPFSSGLKLGFAYCTHREWLGKMLCVKGHQDFGSSNFVQSLIERVIEAGDYQAHLQRIRPHYGRKSARIAAALAASRGFKNWAGHGSSRRGACSTGFVVLRIWIRGWRANFARPASNEGSCLCRGIFACRRDERATACGSHSGRLRRICSMRRCGVSLRKRAGSRNELSETTKMSWTVN